MATNNFKIDTSNYLGISHNTYKQRLLELALTRPEQYFELRETVLKNVKENAIKALYENFYSIMTVGNVAGGASAADGAAAQATFVPNYPQQKVTEFALGAAKTMDALCDECVEIILPLNYRDLAEQRLARKGEAKML